MLISDARYTEAEIRNAIRSVFQNTGYEKALDKTATGDSSVDPKIVEDRIIASLREHITAKDPSDPGSDPDVFWGALRSALSDGQKAEIAQKLFPGYSEEEIRDAVIMLECFYGNGMSLTQTADFLHMHKNTLNYRLNRLTRTTGLNPRSAEGAARYQMCVHMLKNKS